MLKGGPQVVFIVLGEPPFSRALKLEHVPVYAQVLESELADEAEWVTECMARLFIHSRLFQCSRFYGDGIAALDKCPGIYTHSKQHCCSVELQKK